jgi:hypothetical protein
VTDLDERSFRRALYRAVDEKQGVTASKGYYVPIYSDPSLGATDVVSRLLDTIDFSAGQSAQLLSGYRGAGKTSELMRLREDLINRGYSVVYMDLEDFLNPELSPELDAFLLALAAGFVSGSEVDANLSSRVNAAWISFRDKLSSYSIGVDVAASARLNLGPASIGLSLKEDPTFRQQVNDLIRHNRATFVQQLHEFFREASTAIGSAEGVVFLVDSIDHFRGTGAEYHDVRRSIERVFTEGAEALSLPAIHVIYTLPVFVSAVSFGVRREIVNVKVATQDGTVFAPGVEALTEVLRRRTPSGNLARLVDDDALSRLISLSGGMFRDLFRLVREVVLAPGSLPANAGDIDQASRQLTGGLMTFLSAEQLEVLRQVEITKTIQGVDDGAMADVVDLLARSCILAYPNGSTTWHDVHPLLRPLLAAASRGI